MRERCHRFRGGACHKESLLAGGEEQGRPMLMEFDPGNGGWPGDVSQDRGRQRNARRLAEWSCNYEEKTQRCCHCSLLLCGARFREMQALSQPRGHQPPAGHGVAHNFARHARLIVSLYSTIRNIFVKRKIQRETRGCSFV